MLEWMGLNFYYYDGLQPKIRAGIINEHECMEFKCDSLIEILLRLSTAKYWSESLLISVRIAVLDISNDQKKL